MNKTDKIWRLIPLVSIGLYLNYKLIMDADDVFVFDVFFELAIGFGFLIFFIAIIFRDKKEYNLFKSRLSFLPTMVGFFFIISFFATNYLLTARDKSPVLIEATYDGGFNGCGFEFREDGTYKFFNGNGFGLTYLRGSFTMQDSIILLDKSNIDHVIKTNTLVIRPYQGNDVTKSKILVQINDKHEIVDSGLGFIVNEYHQQK